MDGDTEQLIRTFYAGFVSGEFAGIEQYIAEGAEFVNPPEAVEGGIRRGRAELIEIGRTLHEQFAYESGEIQKITEGPNGILVSVRFVVEGRGSGLPMDEVFHHVVQLQNGQVTRLAWFRTSEDAAREAGL